MVVMITWIKWSIVVVMVKGIKWDFYDVMVRKTIFMLVIKVGLNWIL